MSAHRIDVALPWPPLLFVRGLRFLRAELPTKLKFYGKKPAQYFSGKKMVEFLQESKVGVCVCVCVCVCVRVCVCVHMCACLLE